MSIDRRELSDDAHALADVVGDVADNVEALTAQLTANQREQTAATILAALVQANALGRFGHMGDRICMTTAEVRKALVPSAVLLADALRAALKVTP
jgi:hypothetical protein